MQKLFIISNESIYYKNNDYFCDNIDLKSLPEGLNKNFQVNLIGRKSKIKRAFRIDIKDTKIFGNIFSFLYKIVKSSKSIDSKYLIISISPYTFLACIFLKIFGKSSLIYLRSDGYGEYKSIFGFIGPIIYHIMFTISSSISELISCREYILRGKKGNIVSPSQLDAGWFKDTKKNLHSKIKLLYVGRIRKEKGIFSLVNLIKDKNDISLTIVGEEEEFAHNINQNNIFIKKNENNKMNLIKYYDDHNIFILPSFTEGHPMALLEALARARPVIIFEEIKHVIGSKKGIFIAKRNFESLLKTINEIKNNYQSILEEMKQNNLPKHKDFIEQMINIISKSN